MEQLDVTPLPLTPNVALHPHGSPFDFHVSLVSNTEPGHALDWIVSDTPNRWLDISHQLHYVPTVNTENWDPVYIQPANYVPSPGSIFLGASAILAMILRRR